MKPKPLLGIGLMLIAMAILPGIDVIAKVLGRQGLPILEIVWARLTFGALPDLPQTVVTLRASGATFRNDILSGPGGSQILLNDPSGNVIELFQPR